LATTNKNFIVKNGLDANGDISTTGKLYVNASSGDEGGEIFLNKAATNTTINGGVNIDVYQNKLRFWEAGGSARGFYVDITSGGAGVSTSLTGGTTGAMNYEQQQSTKQSGISASGVTIVSKSFTTNGYPVQVIVTGDAENSTAGGWVKLQLFRDSTAIGKIVHVEMSAGSENVPYALTVIDTPSAGTYTYALKTVSTVSTGTMSFGETDGPVLTMIELSGPKGDTGATGTVTGNALTISSPLTGTSFNGSSAVTLGINASSTNTADYVVQRDGSGNFAANQATLVSQKFGLGAGAPSFNSYSSGIRSIYYDNIGAASAGYTVGINSGEFWHTTSDTTGSFTWYGGTTLAATLTGLGALTTVGTITAPLFSGSGASLTSLNGSNISSGTVSSARLPAATSTAIGAIELFSDTVQSVAANSVTATSLRTYGLQVNASGQAVVNVPWTDTDTNTTYDLTSTGTTTASINLVPSSGATDSVTITGSGATSVSHSAGAITVSSTDTNTTYTLASGTNNGTLKLTPSSGGVQDNIAVTGLGTAAYTASSAYATSSHTHAASDIASGTIAIARIPTGSTGTTVSLGNHTHAAITFTTTGGAGAGITYDGGTVRTIDYSTIGAVSNSAVQTVGGAKTFSAAMTTTSISASGNVSTSASLTRSGLAGGGSTTATFDNSGNLVRTTSSARYKQDILSAEYVYEDILALEPKTFRLKNEVEDDSDARTYAGFIAEELDQLDSLKVFVNYLPQENGSKIPDGIQYGEMVSALVSAIKHQDELIKSLTSRIETLENR
jgi:hypothetical protein